jgi:hypothetical protein
MSLAETRPGIKLESRTSADAELIRRQMLVAAQGIHPLSMQAEKQKQ